MIDYSFITSDNSKITKAVIFSVNIGTKFLTTANG